jgi:hypothetical protein
MKDLLKTLKDGTVKKMILDTDVYNEIDDLYALAYAMLSPDKVELLAVTAAPFKNSRSTSAADGMEQSYHEAFRVRGLVDAHSEIPIYRGSTAFMGKDKVPVPSEAADAIIRLAQNVTDGIHVNEKIVEKTLREFLPFMATENLLMEAVKRGGDRQELHEVIRRCSMEATAKMKNGEECDLMDRLMKEEAFQLSSDEIRDILRPELYIGRCPQQVEQFLAKVAPLIEGVEEESAEINL